MKGLKTLAAMGLAIALLASAAPASAEGRRVQALRRLRPLRRTPKPAHVCQKARKKGAFFRSNKGDVFYTVCVKFPTKKNLCAPKQEAVKGTLYVNKITSNIPGKHQVTWFVRGQAGRLPSSSTVPG